MVCGLDHSGSQPFINYYYCSHCMTHPHDGAMAGVAGLCERLLVALLAEDALLLEDKHGVLQLLLAAVADKVLGMPAAPHGCRVRPPEGGEDGGHRVRVFASKLFSPYIVYMCIKEY